MITYNIKNHAGNGRKLNYNLKFLIINLFTVQITLQMIPFTKHWQYYLRS